MIDPKSSDFNSLVHRWCEMQRMKENLYIMNEFDTPETRATRNFFRNRVLNNQIEEAKVIIKSIDDNEDQLCFNANSEDVNNETMIEQSNSIAHSLVQEQNLKLTKYYKKLDELNKTIQNKENC